MNQVLITIGVILNATLMYTHPLLFAALGSCFSEKSGVVNIGLEGMIVIGAFTGAAVGHFVDAPWLAFLCAGLAGGLLALLHAFATVTCQADQTISGTAINFLASGLSVYICFLLFRTSETMPVKSKLPRIFNDLFVWLGNNLPEGAAKLFRQNGFFDLVFNTYASAYIAFLLVIVVWYVFYRTRFGLRLRAVGEHPRAADTLGVNVTLVRYLCVILSGILAGFGGASITRFRGPTHDRRRSGLYRHRGCYLRQLQAAGRDARLHPFRFLQRSARGAGLRREDFVHAVRKGGQHPHPREHHFDDPLCGHDHHAGSVRGTRARPGGERKAVYQIEITHICCMQRQNRL